jgi:riboflavin biosynthesis pyrimidine reductase
MLYEDISLPTIPDRPYFYANFVQTLDGKVAVTPRSSYWPLGSRTDHAALVTLRTQADALVHGKTTALSSSTTKLLSDEVFQQRRIGLGKPAELPYFIVSNHPDPELLELLERPSLYKPTLITSSSNREMCKELTVDVLYFEDETSTLLALADQLFLAGHRKVLLEGGPHLFTSFLEAGLVDELFITISPRFIGNKPGNTLTMGEGILLDPEKVAHFELLSVQPIEDEVYLRYRRR